MHSAKYSLRFDKTVDFGRTKARLRIYVPDLPSCFRRKNNSVLPVFISAENRLIGEVVQSRRRPLLGPLLRHYAKRALTPR